MTGRARGRCRGRARPQEEEEAPRPGGGAEQNLRVQNTEDGIIYSRNVSDRRMENVEPVDVYVCAAHRADAREGGLIRPGLSGATGYTPPVNEMAMLNLGACGGSEDTMARGYRAHQHGNCGYSRYGSDDGRGNRDSGQSTGGRGGGPTYRGNIDRDDGRAGGNAVGRAGGVQNDGQVAQSGANDGTPLPVIANYFKLEQTPDWILYQYNVDFKPDVYCKRIKGALLANHEQLLGATRAFDGEHMLYLRRRLPNEVTEVYSTRNTDGVQIQITFKLIKELPPTSRQCIHILNLIFKRFLKMVDLVQIGRNYYSERNGNELPEHGVKVLPGYLTSVLQFEAGQIFLNIDISHKVVQTETALGFMYNLQEKVSRENLNNPHRQQDFYELCERKVVGSIIITNYNNKTYRVDAIDWDKRPTSTFTLRDGTAISYKDYYNKHYGIEVEDDMQPLFVSRPRRRDRNRERGEQQRREPGLQAAGADTLYFLPELCRLIGFSESYQEDERAKRAVANYTRFDPTKRQRTLSEFISQMNRNGNVQSELGGWGLGFSENPVDITARVLPRQEIFLPEKTFKYQGENAYWYHDVIRSVHLNAVKLQNWLVIHDRRSNESGVITQFIQCLMQVGPSMGIKVQMPTIVVLERSQNEAYIHALKDNLLPSTQLVMCVVPNFAKDRYDAIKKYTCIEHPVPSQVVVLNTIRKVERMRNVASNVAIQINCKLGGEAWTVAHPLKNLMVVGMDVYHDTVTRGQSVVGFVATMNKTFTRFFSDTLFQMTGQELVDGLQKSFVAALKHYHGVNGCLPKTIVVYRDGVGDGQLDAVIQHEVEQIQAAFRRIEENYKPALCVVVVQKRISTRFFTKTGRSYANPPPGTVVDTTVTRPDWVDFYLVSQSVRQGTVSPTHYLVVHDTLRLAPTNLQKLTYKLCHVYFNWPGTIRVPAPCQYAHKLAFLTGESLHRPPAKDLADRLFFL
ncbi:piwi-like protein 1 [Mercenaria mercenaria]|uniref:piwi-like protein 1 n=1 Tax=Mercenaria mercenaria TaxID=6596 RepID=UPI00234F740D|nr:piwi-like protein 1 [Mercenaria mercenaria]XP_053375586.1 piwi-like protein 1 [Mercenaria mercenaria]XP_053375587.1 piwi-like protein 1 [Mercenaria mercenaria]XP_053375588.1 piwi-like protein 1 [Mercenaria mercenaria]XP_053375589.1 piwi-like protein 1 [Mercenaria mercenaria]